jgi:hypothetical protein
MRDVLEFGSMSQAELIAFAEAVGNPPTDPMFADEYIWKFEPEFDWSVLNWNHLRTHQIGSRVIDGPGKDWALKCLPGWPDGHDQYKDWLEKPLTPLVFVCVNGEWELWDGAHRLAASLLCCRYRVPALLGTNKESDPDKWK